MTARTDQSSRGHCGGSLPKRRFAERLSCTLVEVIGVVVAGGERSTLPITRTARFHNRSECMVCAVRSSTSAGLVPWLCMLTVQVQAVGTITDGGRQVGKSVIFCMPVRIADGTR